MLKKLRVKFVCVNMVIVTVLLCVIFGLLFHLTAQNLEQESLRQLRSAASEPVGLGRPGAARQSCFTVRLNRRGEVVSVSSGGYDLSDEALLSQVVAAARAAQGESGVLEEYGLRYYRMASPEGVNLAFADLSGERVVLRDLARTSLLLGAVSFLALLAVSFLLARWAVKPVELAWKQQRQFVADASHELKTPLTVILTNAELLQGDAPAEDRRRFSGAILTMGRQMRGLVESLLELARADNGAAGPEHVPVELSRLTADALLPFEPVFFERGLTLSGDIEPGLSVRGSAEGLRQVVDILLDNAQKYSDPGGETRVTLRRCGRGRCVLCVSDPGPPLGRQERADIFKRFYRADKARAMDHSYGLGLSIAQSVVQAHRGRIWAESEHGRNAFSVELPLL